MTEFMDKERIAKLEANVAGVMILAERRADFESKVLSSLAVIQSKQDDSRDYQKTCDAERAAHEKRISRLENSWKSVWATAGVMGAVAAFVVSVLGLLMPHR